MRRRMVGLSAITAYTLVTTGLIITQTDPYVDIGILMALSLPFVSYWIDPNRQ